MRKKDCHLWRESKIYFGISCWWLGITPWGFATTISAQIWAAGLEVGAAGVVVGGKVPVVITSRSDEAQARLASIAAAVVALD